MTEIEGVQGGCFLIADLPGWRWLEQTPIREVANSENDIKTGQISVVSSGMWSGGVGTLTNFYTSSTQTGSTGEHYFDIYNGVVGTNATASVQFSLAFGSYGGSGSLSGDNDNAASKAIYRQLRNLLLP